MVAGELPRSMNSSPQWSRFLHFWPLWATSIYAGASGVSTTNFICDLGAMKGPARAHRVEERGAISEWKRLKFVVNRRRIPVLGLKGPTRMLLLSTGGLCLRVCMKTGIIGLPSVGKTTIFNVLTHGQALTGPSGGRRLEPNVGIVKVPDPRVDFLSSKFNPEKTTYATIEFVDVQGLVRGKGQDMALAPLRTVDVLVHVVRVFEDASVPHSEASIDPERDKRNLDYELMLADIGSIEKRMERLEKDLKKIKNAALEREFAYLQRAKVWLESEKPLREMEIADDEKKMVKGFA